MLDAIKSALWQSALVDSNSNMFNHLSLLKVYPFAREIKYSNRSVWMCNSLDITNVLQKNSSVSDFWHLRAHTPPDNTKVLFPCQPCHHLLLMTSSTLAPPLKLHGWKPNSTSFISDFHSFFSVPLFYSSASVLFVLCANLTHTIVVSPARPVGK